MAAPMRFLNGVTNVSSTDPLGQLPYPDPTKWVIYHEDFCSGFLGANTLGSTTKTAHGMSGIASANMDISIATDATDAPLGCLLFDNAGNNDNDYGWIQTLSPGFAMKSGKKMILETRFEATTAGNVDENEIFVGLASYSASVTAAFATDGSARAFDDGIGWCSMDGDTNINFIVGENDVFDTQIQKTTYVTATWYTLSCYYDGTDIHLYTDGVGAGKLTPDQIPVSVIGPMFFFKAGEAARHYFRVDYLFAAFER